MRKAIFWKFLQLLFFALVLNSIIFYTVTSTAILKNSRYDMRITLEMTDGLLNYSEDLTGQAEKLRSAAKDQSGRFTVIRTDGTVVADTGAADTADMDNHLSREEVSEALKQGVGHSVRRSETLRQEMLYVAILSSDGEYVLRLSVPYMGMREYLPMLFPAMLLSFAIAFFGSSMEAERFSQSITRPLLEISKEMLKSDSDYMDLQFENCPYEEINVIAATTMNMSRNVQEKEARLEKEKQIRQEFFSNASHELKTPITSIRGYVELLESGVNISADTKQDFLKRIKKETLRMTSLVDDILMISRLESRGAKTELVDILVRDILDEAVSSLEPAAAERSVKIHKEGGDFMIRADFKQMTELFMNLISNAVKYNNPGGQIFLKADKRGNIMRLTVRDNGVGIPAESKERIFERFYRVDKGRSRRQGGTGLGLAIVKHVVNYYNGSVSVESEIGKGSCFKVELPVAVEKTKL